MLSVALGLLMVGGLGKVSGMMMGIPVVVSRGSMWHLALPLSMVTESLNLWLTVS